jgi:hypothetical protein
MWIIKIKRRVFQECQKVEQSTKIPSCLVTEANIGEIFGLGCESLKTTILHLHLDTKKELVKLY